MAVLHSVICANFFPFAVLRVGVPWPWQAEAPRAGGIKGCLRTCIGMLLFGHWQEFASYSQYGVGVHGLCNTRATACSASLKRLLGILRVPRGWVWDGVIAIYCVCCRRVMQGKFSKLAIPSNGIKHMSTSFELASPRSGHGKLPISLNLPEFLARQGTPQAGQPRLHKWSMNRCRAQAVRPSQL